LRKSKFETAAGREQNVQDKEQNSFFFLTGYKETNFLSFVGFNRHKTFLEVLMFLDAIEINGFRIDG